MNKLFIQSRKISQKTIRESGQVAIVTVTMFMVIFAILTVSFTRVMVTASHETASDELKARARAAAESGVEDAKRILTYCYAEKDKSDRDPSYRPNSLCVDKILKGKSYQNCDTILDSNLTNAVGIEKDRDNRAKIDTLTDHERYLCLIIDPLTENVEGMLGGGTGESKVIPLELRDKNGEIKFPTELNLKWHLLKDTSDGGDGIITRNDVKSGEDWPNIDAWGRSPAALRVELVKFDEAVGFSLDNLSQNARALTLRPTRDNRSNSVNLQNFAARDAVNSQTVPMSAIKCDDFESDYACSVKLNIQNLSTARNLPNTTKYYLRIQTIYNSGTHFDLSAKQGSEQLFFLGVQPEVDVTGVSSDAFQRIRARIEAEPSGSDIDIFSDWWPEYAIDTEGKVCKKMKVSSQNGSDEC